MEKVQIGDVCWLVAPTRDEANKLTQGEKPKRRKVISQTRLIMARARLHGYQNVRKVGNGELVSKPTETNGWLVVPPSMYEGIIPREAWEVAETLTQGIPIKGFVVADDKRAIDRRSRRGALVNHLKSVDWQKITTNAGRVVGAIVVVGAVIAFLPAVLVLGAIGIVLSADPLLIAVTEDDEWICVYEWWD